MLIDIVSAQRINSFPRGYALSLPARSVHTLRVQYVDVDGVPVDLSGATNVVLSIRDNNGAAQDTVCSLEYGGTEGVITATLTLASLFQPGRCSWWLKLTLGGTDHFVVPKSSLLVLEGYP